jgi:hypothetical protein
LRKLSSHGKLGSTQTSFSLESEGENMKPSKIFGLVAVAALTLMAFASTASATTLTTNGVKQSGAVTLVATQNGSLTLSDTSNTFANTCRVSTVHGTTSVFTGTVSGPLATLSFSTCTHEQVVVDAKGSLSIEQIGATTNGTVRSSGAEVTVPSTIGSSIITVNCKTAFTDLGTLTGVNSGTSVIDINAVLNCGFFLPSAKWIGSYNITGHSIGVEA